MINLKMLSVYGSVMKVNETFLWDLKMATISFKGDVDLALTHTIASRLEIFSVEEASDYVEIFRSIERIGAEN